MIRAVAAVVLLSGGCAIADARVVETTLHEVTVGAAAPVVVDSRGGAVEVLPGPAGKVTVEARRKAASREEALALPVEVAAADGGVKVTFRGEVPSGASVDFAIRAPADARIQVATGGGAVRLGAFTAPARAQTGGGAIRVDGLSGDLSLGTGGGAIEVHDTAGRLEARTGGGAITVEGAKLRGDCSLKSGGGSIRVALPAETRLRIDASTGGGSISDGLSLDVVGRRQVRGTLGDGSDGSLTVRTGGGGITLARR